MHVPRRSAVFIPITCLCRSDSDKLGSTIRSISSRAAGKPSGDTAATKTRSKTKKEGEPKWQAERGNEQNSQHILSFERGVVMYLPVHGEAILEYPV